MHESNFKCMCRLKLKMLHPHFIATPTNENKNKIHNPFDKITFTLKVLFYLKTNQPNMD